MTVKSDQFLSKSAYARYLGVNEKAIRKAIEEGKIKKGYDVVKKKVNVKEADKEYGFLHKNATAKPGISKAKRVDKITDKVSVASPKKAVKSEKIQSPKFDTDKIDKSENLDDELIDDSEDLDYETLLLKIPVHDKLDYKETVRRREILQLALDKKKLEELEGVLVRRSDVYKALYALGSQLKKAISSIPARCIDDVLSAENKVEAINVLNDEITNVLNTYANFSKVNVSPKT